MNRIIVMFLITALGIVACGQAAADTTATLDSLKVVLKAGDYELAVTESEAVLIRWEQEFGANSLEVAQILDRLVQALNLAGRAGEPRAMELADRAVAIRSEQLGPEHLETSAAQYRRAQILNTLGRSDEAIAALEDVLAVRIRELGPDDRLVCDVYGDLGGAMGRAGRLQDARVQFERMVAILEATVGPDDSQIGTGYLNLASVCQQLGDLPAAMVASQKALANIKRTRGAESPYVAFAQYNLANIHMDQGEVRTAMALFERAVEVLAANDMADHPHTATLLNGLGGAARRVGDYGRAQECFQRALQIEEAAYGPEHPDLSYYLNNLGIVAEKSGDIVGAAAALERSVRLTTDALGADHLRTISSEYYLAVFESRNGKQDQAETRLERCLERLGAELGEDHSRVAKIRGDLALIKEQKNLLAEAEDLLNRALNTNPSAITPAVMAELKILRARVHLRQHDYVSSGAEALEVERAAADQYRLVVQTLSESVSQKFAATRTSGLSVALSALLAQEEPDRPVAAVWDRVLRSRGLLLDELIARRRMVTTSVDPETERLAAEVFDVRSRLADMHVRGDAGRSPEHYMAALKTTREDKVQAEKALAVHSAEFRSTTADRLLGLADIRQALPNGSALVAFQKFERIDAIGEVPWYCAFVLVDDEVAVVDLGAAAVIDGLIDEWRSGMREAWALGGALAEAGIALNRELGARLRDLVWTPCAVGLAGVQRVFVVPDGDLHLLPLVALPGAAGGYLLEEGPTFHYLSREKNLARQPAPVGRGLLALGDPAFDGRVEQTLAAALQPADHPYLEGVFRGTAPDCERLQTMKFGALPGTRRECEQVSSLARAETRLLLGAEATESAFKAGLGGQRIVHLATHGYFLGSDCTSSSAGYADDPLLLSGLALAGANMRTEAVADQEDGIVTAEEVSLLDLTGVQWVVLSACDTGLGVLQPGEGVHGLQRAFETAGAGTVIMSLWPVEDQATRQWMSGLYEARLRSGQTTPAAVRQAALNVLTQRRDEGLSTHPFWWAGFVAVGDWH